MLRVVYANSKESLSRIAVCNECAAPCGSWRTASREQPRSNGRLSFLVQNIMQRIVQKSCTDFGAGACFDQQKGYSGGAQGGFMVETTIRFLGTTNGDYWIDYFFEK